MDIINSLRNEISQHYTLLNGLSGLLTSLFHVHNCTSHFRGIIGDCGLGALLKKGSVRWQFAKLQHFTVLNRTFTES